MFGMVGKATLVQARVRSAPVKISRGEVMPVMLRVSGSGRKICRLGMIGCFCLVLRLIVEGVMRQWTSAYPIPSLLEVMVHL